MTTIVDVADYILNKYGTMTTMKLQKLTFYAQAQALAVTGHPLFEEDFEAWKGGPVSRALYAKHRGMFLIHPGELTGTSPQPVAKHEEAIIGSACDSLSALTGNQLSRRTHSEKPWQEARGDALPNAASSEVISKESIRRFYADNPIV
ncbi:Panacea domain-containing protein [Bifidobacterium pseudolongum]|uniref:Panacea domain-containing protein n=1 Tax=Bifidobacterium pseudolongum TaxID=1694 RepID=UPI001F10D5C7|nr:type II toxin-antitoxin system antitoxin SocA domain-containing protein [Bifidobacterium pseudolongum]MCH4855715.1 DUF4065 domain-containing protein [Bifidobacterium pseudolongum]